MNQANMNGSVPLTVPNYAESCRAFLPPSRSTVKSAREEARNVVKGALLPWFLPPVFTSHDYDAAVDAESGNVAPDPSLAAHGEPLKTSVREGI